MDLSTTPDPPPRPRPAAGRAEAAIGGAITLLLGGAAFAASFTHVRRVAAGNGQPGWVAWAIAVSVELMAVASGLEIRRRRRTRQRAVWPIATLLLGVGMTLAANLATATATVWGRVMAAWPAVAFLAVAGLKATRTTARPAGPVPPAANRPAGGDEDRPCRGDRPADPPTGLALPADAGGPGEVAGAAGGRPAGGGPHRPSPARPAYATTDLPTELLPVARDVAAHLAADGRRLTRDALLAGLRGHGLALSTTRASALLAHLRTTPGPPPTGRTDPEATDRDDGRRLHAVPTHQ